MTHPRRSLGLLSASLVLCLITPVPAHANYGGFGPPLYLFRATAPRTLHLTVDSEHEHVFISDRTSGQVDVMNFDGTRAEVITGVPGAGQGVVLGGELYVTETRPGAIAVIDAASSPPMLQTTISTGSFTTPDHPATAHGRVFFSSGCGTAGAQIAVLTPGPSPTIAAAGISGCWSLAATPAHPSMLLGLGGGSLDRFDASTLPLATAASLSEQGSSMAILPGGDVVEVLDPSQVVERSTQDLSATGMIYPRSYYDNAVFAPAVSGGVFGISGGELGLGFYVPGSAVADHSIWLPYGPGLEAMSDDGSRLFSIEVDSEPSHYTGYFQVSDATRPAPLFTLRLATATIPVEVPYRHVATLVAQLDANAAGQTVVFYRRTPNGGLQAFDRATVGPAGKAVGHIPMAARSTFLAAVSGPGNDGPSWTLPLVVPVTMSVEARMLRRYATAHGVPLFHHGKAAFCLITVRPHIRGQTVRVDLYRRRRLVWRDLGEQTFRLDKYGQLLVYLAPGAPIGAYKFVSYAKARLDLLQGRNERMFRITR